MSEHSAEGDVARLTDKEIELREWLRFQPGGAERWTVVKAGFRRSYDMGMRDSLNTRPDVENDARAGLHAIWREAAEKGIEHGIDWPRVVLDLFRALDRAEAGLAAAALLADEWEANYEKWANVGPDAPKVAILRVHANRLRGALRTRVTPPGGGRA